MSLSHPKMKFPCLRRGYRMFTIEEEQERTLWIGNLPNWVDEKYLCLCFFLFDSVPLCFQIDSWCSCELGELVKIIKDKQTGRSKGYGFMTFQTRDEAGKILYTYNGVKVMPDTKDRLFCLNWAFERSKGANPKYEYSKIRTWAFERSKGAKPKYKYSKIRIMNYSSNDQSQSPARFQLANNNMQVKESSNFLISSSRLSSIPLDLIYDILFRLPVKSIMRLRTTCKAWASFTSTPQFTYQHLKKRMSLNDPFVAFQDSTGEVKMHFFTNYSTEPACSFTILKFKFPSGQFVTCNDGLCTLSNSCNGLVCIYNTNSVNVVNPTIQETAQLPKIFAISKQHGDRTSVGIGYDDSSDTYKIVRIITDILVGTKYEVFTLGGGADTSCNWRQLERIDNYMVYDKVPVFLNGATHWLLFDNYSQENLKSKIILSFDVRTEATHTLPVPEDIGFGTLIELEGCLCVIEIDEEFRKVNLYILEDYANCKWIKKHTINNFLAWFRPVATRDGKLLFSTYYYDMQNGTFEKTGSQRLYYGFKHGCAESLISPISYLQRSKNPCAIFPIFGQRWAAQFPMDLPSFVRY